MSDLEIATADSSSVVPLTPPPFVRRAGKQGAPEPIAALNRIPIEELTMAWPDREPLVDIRTFCPDVRPHGGICPYLRRSVAEKLKAAQAALPPQHTLRIGTALRTLTMQRRGWDGYFARMREEHPDWPLSALRRATNKYHAPYDQPAPPGHCTGGAVDVGLILPDGSDANLVAPTEGWQAAYTWSDKIGPEAKHLRMLMVEAMLGAGFSNCRDEYWHYSWGDSAWAVRVGEARCPYGWTFAPVVLETDFEGAVGDNLEYETQRDNQGKPTGALVRVQSPGCDAQSLPLLDVGLYWAYGTPVDFAIALPSGISGELVLYMGREETWEPVETVERRGNVLYGRVTPTHDRVRLTFAPPPPKVEEVKTS